MAYSEVLADMTREIISLTHQDVEEKKMFAASCLPGLSGATGIQSAYL
jgi:hypothetical protein